MQHTVGWRYRWLTRAACVVFIPHALWKTILTRNTRYFWQRLGFAPTVSDSVYWWHAASVGEIQTVWPLLHTMVQQGLETNSGSAWLVTTNTTTGCDVLQQRLQQSGLAHCVTHAYSPIDTPSITQRFVRRAKPKNVVMVETEIWPNLYTTLHNQTIPISIVNARVTNKTLSTIATGHRLATTLKPAYKAALSKVRVLARSEQDANGYESLGAEPQQVETVGNLKFVDNSPPNCVPPILVKNQSIPYVVAASTHHPEEEELAQQWMQQTNDGLLVIVPRHIERGEKLQKHLLGLFGDAVATQRSAGGVPNQSHRLYLADTLGELHNWYSGASAVFVGGSLISRGGHNVLEPFFHGLPVITGPHTDNFDDAVQWLKSHNAITEAHDGYAVIQQMIKHRDSGLKIENTQKNNLLSTYAKWLNTTQMFKEPTS